jgi:hypothetical protein
MSVKVAQVTSATATPREALNDTGNNQTDSARTPAHTNHPTAHSPRRGGPGVVRGDPCAPLPRGRCARRPLYGADHENKFS